MAHLLDYMLSLPTMCEKLSFDQLLMTGALLTLVAALVLMISGRRMC